MRSARAIPVPVTIAAAAVVLAAYLPSLDGPFFFVDDHQYVVSNHTLQELPLSQSWRIFTSRTNPWEYLPVRDLSYRIDMALHGLEPRGYRIHNLLLYALCGLAAWLCVSAARQCLEDKSRNTASPAGASWFAAAATMLFLAHPAHVESVAWVAGRKDLLSGLFAMLSLWAFATGLQPLRTSRAWWGASYGLFALAILSKSSVVALPVVALLLALATRRSKQALWAVLPLVLLAMGSVALQVFGSETAMMGASQPAAAPWRQNPLALAARILGTLAQAGMFPLHLRLVYDVEAAGLPGLWRIGLGLLAAAVTCGCAWKAVRHRSLACFGVAAAGIMTLPFLQLIPFTTWSFASERFLFLPVLGLAIALAAGLQRLRPAPRTLLVLALYLAGTGLTLARAADWSSNQRLVTGNARYSPSHPTAVRMLIHYVLLEDDRFAEAREAAARVRDEDERVFLRLYIDAKEALRQGDRQTVQNLCRLLWPAAPEEDFPVRVEIANMLLEAGLTAQAGEAYRALLRDFPGFMKVHYNLGLVLARQGRYEDAAAEFRTAIQGGYADATAWNHLGVAYKNTGRFQQAEDALRRALAADPLHWHAGYNLGQLLASKGDPQGALEVLRETRTRALAAGDSPARADELIRALSAP